MKTSQPETDSRIFAGQRFMRIPAGEFIMGSPDGDPLAWGDEHPQHRVHLPYDFWAARLPVSNADFRAFVQATGHVTQAERDGRAWVWDPQQAEWLDVAGACWHAPRGSQAEVREEFERLPAVQVCWQDARAYCAWLQVEHGSELPPGYQFRLPSEAEWEKTARGPQGLPWPWGARFDPGLCNMRESGLQIQTVPLGEHSPQADSVYGVADLCGNAWEWTITLWGADRSQAAFVYPYDPHDGREDLSAGPEVYRIIRGASFKDDRRGARAACRDLDPPLAALDNLGLRVFVAPRRGG